MLRKATTFDQRATAFNLALNVANQSQMYRKSAQIEPIEICDICFERKAKLFTFCHFVHTTEHFISCLSL